MREITSEQMCEWLDATELQPYSYSGRGMFGDRCVAVTIPARDLMALGANLALLACAEDLGEELARAMHDARFDSMGHDMVAYWPDLEWSADLEREYGDPDGEQGDGERDASADETAGERAERLDALREEKYR